MAFAIFASVGSITTACSEQDCAANRIEDYICGCKRAKAGADHGPQTAGRFAKNHANRRNNRRAVRDIVLQGADQGALERVIGAPGASPYLAKEQLMSNITDVEIPWRTGTGIVPARGTAAMLIEFRSRMIFRVQRIDWSPLTKGAFVLANTGKVLGAVAVRATLWPSSNCLKLWAQRIIVRRQLRLLCDLDDHILKDIGMNRNEVAFKAYRPFWLNH